MRRVADSIRKGLEEALAYAKGDADPNAYRVHVPSHRGRLIDHAHLRARGLAASRRFYRAVIEAVGMPPGPGGRRLVPGGRALREPG